MQAEERYGHAGFVCEFLCSPFFKSTFFSGAYILFFKPKTSEMVNISPYMPTQMLRAITELPIMRREEVLLRT